MELTNLARAVGVLSAEGHHPVAECVPRAQARHCPRAGGAAESDEDVLTLGDVASAVAAVLVVWVCIVCTWVLWGAEV